MKLEIHYDPESDTLDIGNGKPASEGYDVADNLTANVDHEGDVVFVTLEHAAKVLAPYLREYIAERELLAPASILRDDSKSAETTAIVGGTTNVDSFGYVRSCDE